MNCLDIHGQYEMETALLRALNILQQAQELIKGSSNSSTAEAASLLMRL